MNRNAILAFMYGSLIGALCMKWYMEKKYDELSEEVKVDESCTVENYHEEPDQEKKVLVMNKDRYEKVVRNYIKAPIVEETPDTHVISFEEFCERYNNRDKVTFMYRPNGDLIDDDGDVIVNPCMLIGDALSRFGEASGDPEVVYVRNNRLNIDYEVVRTNDGD